MDGKRTYNIGVMIGNVHTGHPRELIYGICQGAKDFNVNVILFMTTQSSMFFEKDGIYREKQDYDYQLNTIYDYCTLADLDALIISYGTLSLFLSDYEKEHFVERYQKIPNIILETQQSEPNIMSDNYQGIRNIMIHLIKDHGFKKIAFIGGPEDNLDGQQRKAAYVDAMKEYGLKGDDSLIIHGNYSQYSGEKAEILLKAHPDLEAIVAANDEMAMGAYRVCQRRGLLVGKDIAITGYDNVEMAKSLDPPLTSAEQNGYDMGYRAIIEAIKLSKGIVVENIKMPANMMKRKSCGCDGNEENIYDRYEGNQDILADIDFVSKRVAKNCILNGENKKLMEYIRRHVEELIVYIVVVSKELDVREFVDVDKNYVRKLVRHIVNGKYVHLVSESSFLEEIKQLFEEVVIRESHLKNKFQLINLLIFIQEYVHSLKYMRKEEEFTKFKHRAWVGPVYEKSLMRSIEDEKQVFHDAVLQLSMMKIPNAFIFILEEPIALNPNDIWTCPEKIYLAAACQDGVITAYENNQRPCVDKKNGFTKYFAQKEGCVVSAFTIFSEENQFGMLLCEITDGEMIDGIISAIHTTSLQIGNVLGFMELSKKEREAQKKLGDSLRLLQEKNEVLNFISENDLMTGLLNRRGFGECALKLNRKKNGQQAYFVFADLDHLKEINDTFGHSEGDYAIIEGANVLKRQVEKKGIAGRLGGDEFTLMIVSEEENFEENFLARVKRAFAALNDVSRKPYYVECSLGIRKFICGEDFKLNELLSKADDQLYEAKKFRKKSICREIS